MFARIVLPVLSDEYTSFCGKMTKKEIEDVRRKLQFLSLVITEDVTTCGLQTRGSPSTTKSGIYCFIFCPGSRLPIRPQ